ncbi:hypothetical protein Kpol_473p17 [Vanderwaltozyma polyspora DSM 70294]|uniref:DUF676 domain-containing protein n=1 Tax=Vanderwaltozyma polyspora (strain ATCC 22028 / DSM 70294 / BCRC 21397 / CBS 2163 / NBRC 10782 / NRRL Y-8283 / UCD 57-17) TaxID=436907 RepID=A7TQ09_VANPO|nr:uncharacterized protein Kpol_473p17 [Vanderwaltozyma polyspora DSM 70294]EDO15658.1 hypothetical protein Kpol_473p17 [Vanderwaltozyma polyspora DSM 70294]
MFKGFRNLITNYKRMSCAFILLSVRWAELFSTAVVNKYTTIKFWDSMAKHLVILLHGLWGNYKHMDSLLEMFQKVINDRGSDSNDSDAGNSNSNFVFYSAMENAKFKTLDGIEIVGYRTLIEISQFIKNSKYQFNKISVIGYSLGGIIGRFIIGKMFTDCKEIFEGMQPILFLTLATPHVGVDFYNLNHSPGKAVLITILKSLGTTILGKSGKELFISNSENDILVKMTTGEFIEGLKKFQYRVVLANVKNDRTVPFYTSFITDSDPFLVTENCVKYNFDFNIPNASYSNLQPKILDLNELNSAVIHSKDEYTTEVKLKMLRRVPLIILLMIIFLPLALIINTGATIYRYIVTRQYRRMIKDGNTDALLRKGINGFDDKVRGFVEDTYESLISIDRDGNSDDLDITLETNEMSDDDETVYSGISWEEFVHTYSQNWKPENPNSYVKEFGTLPLDNNRKIIVKNLNELEWVKIPIYIKALNAHRDIVARNGLKQDTPNSVATVEFIGYLVRYLIKTSSK